MKEIEKVKYVCNNCGDEFISFNNDDRFYTTIEVSRITEDCQTKDWLYCFNLESGGYGSFLDGREPNTFHICDHCLEEWFANMRYPPESRYMEEG